MSVCSYFAGNDAQYAENPAGTKKFAEPIRKNVDSEVKSVLPVP